MPYLHFRQEIIGFSAATRHINLLTKPSNSSSLKHFEETFIEELFKRANKSEKAIKKLQ